MSCGVQVQKNLPLEEKLQFWGIEEFIFRPRTWKSRVNDIRLDCSLFMHHPSIHGAIAAFVGVIARVRIMAGVLSFQLRSISACIRYYRKVAL